MIDTPEYERWHRAAIEALNSARAERDWGVFHWACFLAEQGAQLVLKGFLHGVGAVGWGHDLADLIARTEETLSEEAPEHVRAATLRLSRHYIATRYPDAHPSGTPGGHYSRTDAETAVQDVEDILTFVQERWDSLREEALEGEHGGDARDTGTPPS